jgi:uncharacterized membrane protein
MKTNKLMLCVLGLVLVFTVASASAADAPRLTFKFHTKNVPGAVQTFLFDINNAGVMVGQYEDSSGGYHGYILDGKKTTLDDPKGIKTAANGIKPNGAIVVVGAYTNNSTHQSMGFLYNAKTKKFKDITGPAHATSSGAIEINDEGWIVGQYADSSNKQHGFLLQGKKYTTLDVPTAIASGAYGINNKGKIVLTWVNSSGAYEGALTTNFGKTYTTINVPDTGPQGSFAECINNEGDIVFLWFDSSRLVHGALSHDGTYYKFSYPKVYESNAYCINDKNAIVGTYQTTYGGNWSGYVATFK